LTTRGKGTMQVMHTKSNKSNQLNRILLYILPCIALAIIAALSIASRLVNTSPANAESSSDSMNVSVQAESLNVSLESNSIILDIAPTYEGIFKSTNPVKVYVDTTNTYGYNLIMTATTTTSLTSTVPLSDGTTYPTIATLGDNNGGSGYDSTNFPTNRWGYAVNGSNFLPVANSTTLRTTDGTDNTADRTNNLSFGTKLNTEITTGNYNITLNFVATTNSPSNLEDFDAAFIFAGKTKYNGYYKMQDMTANICSYVATPTTTTSAPSTQLIDTRDNKIYWVSKLKDGNCWMTQNLDLNLDSSIALTSANTDLHSVTSWTPVRSTINSTGYNNTASGASGGILTFNNGAQNDNFASDFSNSTSSDMTVNADNTPYSADPGYRYVVPKEMSGPNTNWYDNGDTFYYCANQDTTCGGNSENGHYTMGNFYNFAAANATNNVETTLGGSANVVQNKVMPDSICPKGWRLPIAKTTNNEFNTLLGASNYNVTSNFNFAGLNAIRTAPLYFVRSGRMNGGTLNHAGANSDAWSSTIRSSTNGYQSIFDSADIDPAHDNHRFYGFPIRCLAHTSISDLTYMQEFATMTDAKKEEIKNTMVVGQAYQLIDNRDNEIYNVAKLADGNVWLLDNLRLDPATLLQQLTPANTNMDPNTPFTLPASSTDKFSDNTAGWTTPGINTSLSNTISTNGVYQGDIGVFYNYCAASAGTICAAKDSNNDNASYDICPASWRMPTGGTDGEYQALYTAYSSNSTNFQTALRTPLSGYFVNGSAYDQGSYGLFWSSTRRDGNDVYRLSVDASSAYPQYSNWRLYGTSVRCLLK
ncbi:hypothetical protein IJG29_03670, partial [Candidatus Saccharibacteria bacterium]|nr:hypothetical protein [Candidatus Saccharibacteria bacterium]